MRVAVPKETAPGERRVALVPETISKLREAGFEARVERGAGEAAGFADADYETAGAELSDDRSLLDGSEALACVASPAAETVARMVPGTVVVGFLEPLTDADGIARLRERGVVGFAMESIPRITRAQSMDALSSQATVSGYKAVVLAADRVPRRPNRLISRDSRVILPSRPSL
jgi:NAD(P) transhydrogenase subunit alpha